MTIYLNIEYILHCILHSRTFDLTVCAMDKRVDSFVDKFLEKWSSSHVDIRIHVQNLVNPIEVTVIVYVHVIHTLCKAEFKISSESQYRCFKRSTEGLLVAYCRRCHQNMDWFPCLLFVKIASPNYSVSDTDSEESFDGFDSDDINDCHDRAIEI